MWLTLDRHIIYGLLNHSGINSRCSSICSIFAFFIFAIITSLCSPCRTVRIIPLHTSIDYLSNASNSYNTHQYIVWLLYKSVELKINEIPLDLQHVHCWEGGTFSSNFSFWLSSPLLLMQYSKIQPKKSNAKNGKDERVFFWGWMVYSPWTNFWYMMENSALWVITLILHQFVDFFTLQMGASTLTHLYLATMGSLRKLV
jgi:hypothetical protein